MKSLNLTGSQAQIVIKSLNERLYEFDEELDALESRIIEIRMKKSQLNNLLAELGETPALGEAGPKKRGRKPGVKKEAVAAEDAAPKKRGRKPGVKKEAAATAEDAAPKKRGRKPGVKKEAAPKAAPGKRGRKPGSKVAKAAGTAPKKAVSKAAAPKKAGKTAATKTATAGKTEAAKAAPAKKSETPGKRGRKSGGENTLAAKIVTAITDAKKGLTTREIVDSLNSRYGAEKDERKLIQAISSTLISLTKRGKIKRETGKDGQILNIVMA